MRLQKTSFDQALMGMEVIDSYGTKFDKTKHGSLFLSKVCVRVRSKVLTILYFPPAFLSNRYIIFRAARFQDRERTYIAKISNLEAENSQQQLITVNESQRQLMTANRS